MRQIVTAPCPDCGKEIKFIYDTENIPYFSDILLISGVCECGFRIVDTMILNEREPCIWEMEITEVEDLNARVVRSTAGEIDVEELGLNVKPGPACSGFVSNVEGVLTRAESAVKSALLSAEGDEIRCAMEVLENINKARNGEFPFTLKITDPSGNSGIVSPKAKRTKLDVEREDGMSFVPYN